MTIRIVCSAGLAVVALVACSSGTPAIGSDAGANANPDSGVEGCIQGRSVACACVNGLMGAQVCRADGTFGACTCLGSPGVDSGTPDSGGQDAGPSDAGPTAGDGGSANDAGPDGGIPIGTTVTGFTPAFGPVGTSVTIIGTAFSGATFVAFNATNATVFSVDSETQLTATVPPGATSGPISVTTPSGTGTTSGSFTVTTPVRNPTLTSFSPASGPVGTAVVLSGTLFTGASAVAFNGQAASSFAVDSDTQITATVPPGATSGTLSVTAPGGTAMSATAFTVSTGTSTAILLPAGQIIPSGTTSARTFSVSGATSAWTAISNNAWIVVNGGASGSGDGSVKYLVSPNSGAAPRIGTLTAAGQTFTVWQDGTETLVHPRLWVNPGDVLKYRGWATSANPVYEQGMVPLISTAVMAYEQQFFPGGVQNSTWPDPGDSQGYTGLMTETYAFVFAFDSLINPDPATRILDAQRAHDLIMVPMNIAALGPLADAPFRDPSFPIYNRAGQNSELWPLIVDWIYNATDGGGTPILTAQDKATIRAVFLSWAPEILNASTTGGDHPDPVGTLNDLSLLPPFNPLDPTNAANLPPSAYRMAANNYYLDHSRLLTLMSMFFDPADDPVITAGTPASTLGNTLGSYLTDALGAWIYQEYAMYGEPADVQSAYGLPSNSVVGLASGGLPPEGMLYGESFGTMFGQLLALKTAGLDDPLLAGPQIALIEAPVWRRFVPNFISSLVPAAQVFTDNSYLGPLYQMFSYGDLQHLYITDDFSYTMGLLGLLQEQNGDTSELAAERWFLINVLEGGASNLYGRISDSWSWGVQDSMAYYMLLDPAAATPADPRPGYPTTFYDSHLSRIVSHSDWTADASVFDYLASWEWINHQDANAGQFEFYRKGEWLTKELSNYSDSEVGQSSLWHNTLSLQNWAAAGQPANLATGFDAPFWQYGSQWPDGGSTGDPVTVESSGTGYTYAQSNNTLLYNAPEYWTPDDAAMDILLASRSILWLQPDTIVVYDRATSQHAGLFKQFNLNFVTQPEITGTLLTSTSTGGQELYVQTLLPANPMYTWVPIDSSLGLAELEPTIGHMVIEDAANPADISFLNVLQGADPGVAPTPAHAFKDATGTAFDGAVIGSVAVLFPIQVGTVPTTVSWTVPSTVQGNVVTGLTPGAAYDLQSAWSSTGTRYTVVAGTTYQADAAGVLTVGSITP